MTPDAQQRTVERSSNADPEKVTADLKAGAREIVRISDFESRKKEMIQLITNMDTQAMLDTLQKAGIRGIKPEKVREFIRQSVTQALDRFDSEIGSQPSAKERSAKARGDAQFGAVETIRQQRTILELINDLIADPSGVQTSLLFVNSHSRELAEAFVSGTLDKVGLNKRELKTFIYVTFGAHARWAGGQVERQIREGGDPLPIERPIFGDLRRVEQAVIEQARLEGNQLTPAQIHEKAVDIVELDWKEFWEVASGEKKEKRD